MHLIFLQSEHIHLRIKMWEWPFSLINLKFTEIIFSLLSKTLNLVEKNVFIKGYNIHIELEGEIYCLAIWGISCQ